MKLSELLEKVGDANMRFQPLDGCTIRAKYDHKKGSEITFGTDQVVMPDGTQDYGMIVWIPREKLKEVMAAEAS